MLTTFLCTTIHQTAEAIVISARRQLGSLRSRRRQRPIDPRINGGTKSLVVASVLALLLASRSRYCNLLRRFHFPLSRRAKPCWIAK